MNGRNTGLSLLLAALLAAGTLTGCGAAREQLTGQVEKIAGQVIGGQKEEAEEAEEQEQENQGSEEEGPEKENLENSERGADGQAKGADAGSQDTGAVVNGQNKFSFEDLKGWKFIFSSGAGAWSTDFQIYGDGTFDGIFHDSDMGDTGPGYPNGTVYYSEFNGRFTEPRKVDDNTYVFQVDSINYPLGFGDEIKDGCYYAYREAYGLDGAEDLYLYLPGSRLADLPEDFLSWVGYHNLSETEETELPFYGIYNEKEGSGISSYYDENSVNGLGSDGAAEVDSGAGGPAGINSGQSGMAGTGAGTGSGFGQSAGTGATSGAEMGVTSDGAARIQAEIARAEEEAARLEEALQSAQSQMEMTRLSGELYTVWDDALNAIWKILKENLDEASMEQLTVEERQWIKDKEAAAEAAGAEFAGGTAQSMVITGTAAELTRTRVYELAEYLR